MRLGVWGSVQGLRSRRGLLVESRLAIRLNHLVVDSFAHSCCCHASSTTSPGTDDASMTRMTALVSFCICQVRNPGLAAKV